MNLALQGGGAHGTFTWGVLDRLCQEDRFTLSTISATSAGAVNAVALLGGLLNGGPEGARKLLRELWVAIVQAAAPDLSKFHPLLAGLGSMESFQAPGMAELAGMLSPYAFNPFDFNPLRCAAREGRRDEITRIIDRQPDQIVELRISVRRGARRVALDEAPRGLLVADAGE